MRRLLYIILPLLPLISMAQEPFDYKVDRVSSLSPMHKGEYVVSVSATFGDLSTSNSSLLLLLQDIDANGSISTIKPSVGYFYSDRSMAGLRFAYSDIAGQLSSAILDLGTFNDLELSIPFVGFDSRTYSFGAFHRSYTKIDAKGRFELFSEIELLYSYGCYNIAEDITGSDSMLRSKTSNVSISFNPGLSVNITPNVASFVSFGLGGFSVNNISQYNQDWEYIGKRTASQFNLSVDLFAINFGLTFHFWSGEK
ncbi:MAG: hypothetical protein SNF93_00630 [Rikenellaceae bacterium]